MTLLVCESKKCENSEYILVNTTKKKQTHKYTEQTVVTNGEREGKRENTGIGH